MSVGYVYMVICITYGPHSMGMEYPQYEAHIVWTWGHHQYESMHVLTIHENSLNRL